MKIRNKKIIYSVVFLLLSIFGFSYGSLFLHSTHIQNKLNLREPKSSAGDITIVTPENITYTEPDSGYYPATYGFDNDQTGSDPGGWNVGEGAGSVNVIESIDGHNKVVELYDINSDRSRLENIVGTKDFGTVEFWFRTNKTDTYITLHDGTEPPENGDIVL